MTKTDELILALLGRIAFPSGELRSTVRKNKRNAQAYVRGYNSCDGRRSVSDVAGVIGVTVGTLVPILQEWERAGIIYEVETEARGKFYHHLYQLED